MRFQFSPLTDFEGVQHNFEQVETRFGFPVYTSAPVNPQPGQAYWDSTKDAAGVAALGYWGPVNGWRYV